MQCAAELAPVPNPSTYRPVDAEVLDVRSRQGDIAADLELSVTSRGNGVDVCVKDNGIGIATNHLEDVFLMFTQASEATARSRDGVGIGPRPSRSRRRHEGNCLAS